MTAQDLSRWNRAGQHRLEYIDGTGPVYLERIKEELLKRFEDRWSTLPDPIELREETGLIEEQAQFQRNNELIDQYYTSHKEIGWDLAKVFSQACHVLTGHLNAHANEAFLRTTTQWENVRRLVELIDYHPAAATSSSTRLVLIAKENKSGVVDKGFQVKYTPATGGAKVVFETLEEISIDSALNQLRPKGWNQSEKPPLPPSTNGPVQKTSINSQASSIAKSPAINIHNVGREYEKALNVFADKNLDAAGKGFRIQDFQSLDINNPDINIPVTRLHELKAKADTLCNFKLESSWFDIVDMKLAEVISQNTQALAEKTGNTLQMTEVLKSNIETLGFCLDHAVFIETRLVDLIADNSSAENISLTDKASSFGIARTKGTLRNTLQEPTTNTKGPGQNDHNTTPASVETLWRAKRKPKVVSGQVVMIYREYLNQENNKFTDQAEAAIIDKLDIKTNTIHLLPSSMQYTWNTWKRSEAKLRVSPRWQRKCWLNGPNVIRTREPHGLTAGTFIGWDINRINNGVWNYAEIIYAEIIETDKRNIRLAYNGDLPDEFTELIEMRPIDSTILSADYEAIVLINNTPGEDNITPTVEDVAPNLDDPVGSDKPKIESIFTLKKFVSDKIKSGEGVHGGGGGGGGLLPPASLPKIGSFLFPSPMLPMDLVKIAVDLMLSIGVMVIPSTGEIVIKGMPFGGLLEDAGSDPVKAAEQLFKMLNKLEGTVQECNANGELLWKLKNGTFDIYVEPEPGEADPYERDGDQLVPYQIQQTNDGTDSGDLLWKLKNGGADVQGRIVYGAGDDPIELGSVDDPYLRDGDNYLVPAYVVEKLAAWEEPYISKDDQGDPIIDDQGHPVPDVVKIVADLSTLLDTPEGKEATALFKIITDNIYGKGPLLTIPQEPPIKAIVDASEPRYVFSGSPNKIESGDWLVGEFSDGLRAVKVSSLNELDDGSTSESFAISFERYFSINSELKKLYADFRGELISDGASNNTDPATSPEHPEEIELDSIPEGLKVGRKLLLISATDEQLIGGGILGGAGQAGGGEVPGSSAEEAESPTPVLAKIESITKSADGNFIKTSPPASGFTKGNLLIFANVVDASHGTAKPIKRLSSGLAGEQSYSLLFDVNNVSTVPDATFPRGVRADLEVIVDDLIWQQVPGLDSSKPTDSHYVVRVTEEGYLRLIFGGRRLPSGTNNVSVRYRVGAGRFGNLTKGRLVKPVSPHPLVSSVFQPVASIGGEDKELVNFMRQNAPGTLLALERSVSLVDFENLAMNRNDIWQAKAFYHPAAASYLDLVRVVVIPAGAADIEKKLSDDSVEKISTMQTEKRSLAEQFKREVENYLTQQSVPTVSIRVESYQPVEIKLMINIRIDFASYEPIPVVERIRERILEKFTLEHRQINQAFYLSEVYQVVETTKGVADSHCVFQDESAHQLLPESEDQVLYLSQDPDHLLIEYKAYTP